MKSLIQGKLDLNKSCLQFVIDDKDINDYIN